jgi:L-fuconolactonase
MDTASVGRAVVVQPIIDQDPRPIIEMAQQSDGRLIAVADVDLQPDLVSRIDSGTWDGAVGLRVRLPDDVEASALSQLFGDVVHRLPNGVSVIDVLGRPHHSSVVRSIAERNPSIAFVNDHLGRPTDPANQDDLDAICGLAFRVNVSVKLSAMHSFSRDRFPHRDVWPWAAEVVRAFGRDRVMWGSNWPLATASAPYGVLVEATEAFPFVDRAWLPAVLGETAGRLWRFG